MVKSHHKVQWTSFQSVGRGILNLLILTEACLNRTNNTNKIYTQDIYICACVCVRVCAWTDVCSEHYSCVCRCMSVEEAGAGKWGENVSEFSEILCIYFIFIVILNVPS